MIKLLTVLSVLTLTTKTYSVTWYGNNHHGKKTASGEVFDKNKYTCAATSKYDLGETLKVTNIDNGKSVVVKVNDRGGFASAHKELDLSEAAFKKIAPLNRGVIKVSIKKL